MTTYAYSYDGKCEPDETGRIPSLVKCRGIKTGPNPDKELRYQLFQYDLAGAKRLAPTDRLAVLHRHTGVELRLTSKESTAVIEAILANDYEMLVQYPSLLPWIRARHPFALVFEVEAGTLDRKEVSVFNRVEDKIVTAWAVRGGIVLDNLRGGDTVRFEDVPLDKGRFRVYDEASRLLVKVPYQGYEEGIPFAINFFPRVDYFRYALPGTKVQLSIRLLPEFNKAVVTQVSSRVYRVVLDRYRIFTDDVAELGKQWKFSLGRSQGLGMWFVMPMGDERPDHLTDLYTENLNGLCRVNGSWWW